MSESCSSIENQRSRKVPNYKGSNFNRRQTSFVEALIRLIIELPAVLESSWLGEKLQIWKRVLIISKVSSHKASIISKADSEIEGTFMTI